MLVALLGLGGCPFRCLFLVVTGFVEALPYEKVVAARGLHFGVRKRSGRVCY
jgi:hypothetical protein